MHTADSVHQHARSGLLLGNVRRAAFRQRVLRGTSSKQKVRALASTQENAPTTITRGDPARERADLPDIMFQRPLA